MTQRTFTEKCFGQITVDASKINEGDFAGLCALEGEYAFIAITKKENKIIPLSSEDEVNLARDIFNVEGDIGTVGHGNHLVGACTISNSNGAIIKPLSNMHVEVVSVPSGFKTYNIAEYI